MSTLTAKLGLAKPDPDDNVDVTQQISDNFEKIDDAFASIIGAYKNKIRNGDFGVAQRGNGSFNVVAANAYTLDGWYGAGVGGSYNIARGIVNAGISLGNAKHATTHTIAGQAAVGDFANFRQRIEDVRTFAGKEVTLSFETFASAGTPKIGIEVEQNFGTGGAPSALVQTAIEAVTISAVRTRYDVTFTIPSIIGKTLGTNGDDYVTIIFWLSAGTTFNARASAIGIQNVTIDLLDIQLEEGSVATAFERLPQQVQLAWCQRYYVRFGEGVGFDQFGQGIAFSTTQAVVWCVLPVEMRVAPTMPENSGGLRLTDTVSGISITGVALDAARTSKKIFAITATVASGLTQFRPYTFETETSAGFIAASAEL